MRRLYFDWNASTPLRAEVIQEHRRVEEFYGNPSSVHAEGRQLRSLLEECRRRFLETIDARGCRVLWTSGATESNNLVIHGFAEKRASLASRKIVTTAVEHAAVNGPLKQLESRGWSVTRVVPNRVGVVDSSEFIEACRDANFCSAIDANNELGALQPLREIASNLSIPLHSDATQALGKIKFSFRDLGLAAASFSAHKLGGPRGVGALVIREDSLLAPFLRGGEQEFGFRPGTENVAGIAAFTKAAELAVADLDTYIPRMKQFGELFRSRLSTKLPGVRFLNHPDFSVPNTTAVLFPKVDGRSLVVALDLVGVAVSVGSACASGSVVPSHVLKSIGLTDEEARSAVRISMGRDHTEADVLELVDRIAGTVIGFTKS